LGDQKFFEKEKERRRTEWGKEKSGFRTFRRR